MGALKPLVISPIKLPGCALTIVIALSQELIIVPASLSPQYRVTFESAPPVLCKLTFSLAAEDVISVTECKFPRIGGLTEVGVVKLCTGDQLVPPVPPDVLSPLNV